MTIREYIKKYNENPHDCYVDREDGGRVPGFIYSSEAEYNRLFDRTYGDMEIKYTYCKDDILVFVV